MSTLFSSPIAASTEMLLPFNRGVVAFALSDWSRRNDYKMKGTIEGRVWLLKRDWRKGISRQYYKSMLTFLVQ